MTDNVRGVYLDQRLALRPDVERPRFFSRTNETVVSETGKLPHWEQSGKAVFVTFRLADSMPADKLDQWREEEDEWLRMHPLPWNESIRNEYDKMFSLRMEKWLDSGYGECLMKDDSVRKTVESALEYFNGVRYVLYGYVVMPNHVHACFMPRGEFSVAQILHSWKSFTAKKINSELSRSGIVWQKESFDRYIRDGEHFERVLRYIRRNDPGKAWLATMVA